ncbi:hypothetical protein N7466_008373 [Penicillium verhagenii]|uniref:uncharacterized protein n=1 Tax=Penicillium verhagenii TaxID=1562060 RepID=UPI002545710E|nr:uncharacterized protein N7466_008373 [Penicillium verhagenii]KAJ5924186.1 hypothetical protein N7466_008373 [Penicillium verhagenii]
MTEQTSAPARFGSYQTDGMQLRLWIANPNEPGCHVKPSTLTYAQLEQKYGAVKCGTVVPENFMEESMLQKIAEIRREIGSNVTSNHDEYENFKIHQRQFHWYGVVGPGFLDIEVMNRIQNPNNVEELAEERATVPTASSLAQAFYQRNFDIKTLRSVYVTTVINSHTLDFIAEQLYPAADLAWHADGDNLRTWDYGTPAYDGMLGTRIGKVIAYLVLGAFPRGTRRITRIVTYDSGLGAANIRFDIAPV